MEVKFTRIALFYPEEIKHKEETSSSSGLCIRFVRNLKFTDFFARSEEEYDSWVEALSKYMIRTDFHQRYHISKQIGEGSFAKVYLVTNKKTGKKYAVKAFNKDFAIRQNRGKDSIKSEISTLMEVNHQNINSFVEAHETTNSLYIVLEYLEGGTLKDFLKKLDDILEEEQILQVVLYLLFTRGGFSEAFGTWKVWSSSTETSNQITSC